MIFQNEEASLQLDVSSYEIPHSDGTESREDLNWLVLRGLYREEELVVKDSNSCLLTYELQELTAGLKVLRAGIRQGYQSDFQEPYFAVTAWAEEEDRFVLRVSFALLHTMEDLEEAEVESEMTGAQLRALTDELDRLCKRFPVR